MRLTAPQGATSTTRSNHRRLDGSRSRFAGTRQLGRRARETARLWTQAARPEPPDWVIQLAFGGARASMVHQGTCTQAGHGDRWRVATAQQARETLRDQVAPCALLSARGRPGVRGGRLNWLQQHYVGRVLTNRTAVPQRSLTGAAHH
ncbi:DUF6233 domain-containing protein [Streptomyces sp. BV129]|uniref:DUF6233 domain-containing protein n=1 Tax=Streptomyces sp. BV129 TaxID=2849671 RepID=UPI0035ABA44D